MHYSMLPSSLVGFTNDYTKIVTTTAGKAALLVHGNLEVTFQARGHRITERLYNFVRDLLSWGLTLKIVSKITGLCKNTVKQIDLACLVKPERLPATCTVTSSRRSRTDAGTSTWSLIFHRCIKTPVCTAQTAAGRSSPVC